MHNLTIEIINHSHLTLKLQINHQEIPLKKRKQRNHFIGKITLDEELLDISISSYQALSSRYWFILSYLFFLISFLGIFDTRYDTSGKSICYQAKVSIKEQSNLCYTINPYKKDETAAIFKGESIEKENHFFIDQEIKKRYKKLKTAKILTWIMGILIGILCVFLFLF